MRHLIVGPLALTVHLAVAGHAHSQPIAVTQYGTCGVALMRDGDVFLSSGPTECLGPQGAWVLSGNVFALSGQPHGRVAGITTNAQVLTVDGGWFQLITGCPGTPVVTLQGNVFEITGVGPSAGEEFATFGGGMGVGVEYAVTNYGSVYRWQGGGCPNWTYLGALPIGPTAVEGRTWGRLKTRYRTPK